MNQCKDKIKIASFEDESCDTFGDLLTGGTGLQEIKAGLLGCGYFEYWRMYPELEAQVRSDLEGIHRRISKHFPVIYPGMVDTLDSADAAGKAMAAAQVEVVIIAEGTYLPDFIILHALSHLQNPQIILLNTQTGENVSAADNYQATMRNSALIGISQLSGSLLKMKRDYRVLVGEISEAEVYRELASLVKVQKSVKKLKTMTFGLIGHVFRGMYDLEFDRAKVKGGLGPEVVSIQADHLVNIWRDIPAQDVKQVAGSLCKRFRRKKATPGDVEKSCRLLLAMRKLVEKYHLNALCFLGQHYIEKMTSAPARMGASALMEEDQLMVACEGDIGGLVMMQLMYDFSGNLPLQAEWGQFDLKHNALFLLGHGIGAPQLAAADDKISLTCAPEEWGFEGSGLNYEFIVKPGPVTLGHFIHKNGNWRMLISEGESIEFPCLPCDEIHAMVKVQSPVKDYLKEVLSYGVSHHLVLVHGNIVSELSLAADLMGIEKLIIK